MRLIKSISWMLLCGTLAFFCSRAGAQTTTRVAGQIVVAKAEGTVTAIHSTDLSERRLVTNDRITQQYTVKTGLNSRVVLVFSNGAALNLGSDTVLSIDEFLQDPFSDKVTVTELKEEPSTSSTRLSLARGELVGNVKHLRHDKGSSFIVNTPVGAAGIRGTTFQIIFRTDANGHATFSLTTSEGTVVFEAPGNAPVSVGAGNQLRFQVDVQVNPTTGAITVTSPIQVTGLQGIPAAEQVAIAAQVQAILDAAKDVILATVPADSAVKPETSPADPTNPPVDPETPPVDPTNPPADPTASPADPATSPANPADPPADPTAEPADPATSPANPANPPTDPTAAPADPATSPTNPTNPPADPTAAPADAANPATDPANSPANPADNTTKKDNDPTPSKPVNKPPSPREVFRPTPNPPPDIVAPPPDVTPGAGAN